MDRDFKRIHAQHVRSNDGVDIEFIDLHNLRFANIDRVVTIPVETFIANDGAPDGVVVCMKDIDAWDDKSPMTSDDKATIWAHLQQASDALRTAFRKQREI